MQEDSPFWEVNWFSNVKLPQCLGYTFLFLVIIPPFLWNGNKKKVKEFVIRIFVPHYLLQINISV